MTDEIAVATVAAAEAPYVATIVEVEYTPEPPSAMRATQAPGGDDGNDND